MKSSWNNGFIIFENIFLTYICTLNTKKLYIYMKIKYEKHILLKRQKKKQLVLFFGILN